jgi:hypothetical protein
MSRAVDGLIDRLLAARAPGFAPPPLDPGELAPLGASGAPGTPHRALLERENGGYFFGGALHLFGACAAPAWHSLAAWNAPDLWRGSYGGLADGLVLFGEDAFGDQLGYSGLGGEVVRFEAEVGRAAPAAPHFAAWLEALLEAPEAVLPVRWVEEQARIGKPAAPGSQLYAYPPFAAVESRDGVTVGVVDAVEAMRVRGELARQIGHLPPGTQVRIDIGD